MKSEIKVFEYNGSAIEFDLINHDVMINATEMAKPFGKIPKDFLINEQTRAYINAACKDNNFKILYPFQEGNSPFETREKMVVNIIHGGKKNGTWMHRQLALKFAAWLSPDFEFWVYNTIDELLYSHLRKAAEIDRVIEEEKRREEILHQSLMKNPEYAELFKIQTEQKGKYKLRNKLGAQQLNLFKELFS